MSLFTNSPLHVEPVGKRSYRLLSPIIWQLIYKSDVLRCIIPAGHITDFDSTPWYARPLLPSRWRGKKAHALHDWGYGEGWVYCKTSDVTYKVISYDRAHWDKVWYHAMLAEGMSQWVATLMYKTLRLVGGIRWGQLQQQRHESYLRASAKQKELNITCLNLQQSRSTT